MLLFNKIKDKINLKYRKKRWPGLINAYKQYLPITNKTPIVTLNEGNTPLIFSNSISKLIGNGTKVYLIMAQPTVLLRSRMTMAIQSKRRRMQSCNLCKYW